VILRRSAQVSFSPEYCEWLMVRCVAILTEAPYCLSVCGGEVAVCGTILQSCETFDSWMISNNFQLLSLSTGHCISRKKLRYDIFSIFATAKAVIVSTGDSANFANGHIKTVVEAYSRDMMDILWRCAMSEGLSVPSLCVLSTDDIVYAVACQQEAGGGQIMALEGANKSKRYAVTVYNFKDSKPEHIALTNVSDEASLAVLSYSRPNELKPILTILQLRYEDDHSDDEVRK